MKISVIMAVYNGEKYIGEQLESILNQTRKPDEIIICDDCSTDLTVKILENYKLKYDNFNIKILKNIQNLGYKENFIQGLMLSKGDYIFLSDQDDIWVKNKIESMMCFFNKHKDAKGLVTSYSLIDELGNPIKNFFNLNSYNTGYIRKVTWKKFIKHPCYPGMALAVKADIIKMIKEDYKKCRNVFAHDWLVNRYASAYGTLYYWDKKYVYYRQHKNNVVGVISQRNLKSIKIERINMLKNMQYANKVTAYLNTYDYKFIRKLDYVIGKRIEYLDKSQLFKIICFDIIHLNYISVRSFLGDVYTVINDINNSIRGGHSE